MARLQFFGGVNEIGGNKIMVTEKQTKILLDFGQSFDFGTHYFTSWLTPRSINGVGDHFEFNLLPRIAGLYAQNQLAHTDLPYGEPTVAGVFLSHGHFDHVAHICFIDPQIPVYLGVGTKLFMESMEETSPFCNYRTHAYQTFRTGKKITLDDFEVEPVHVDHSIPAAYGFIIRTSEATIVYTGDLRLHGPRRDLTEEFLNKAQKTQPDALICEGTRLSRVEQHQNFSEAHVAAASNTIVSGTDRMVFVTHYSRDMDRFRSFYTVAVKNNRAIVISPKIAYLLIKLRKDHHLKLPNPLTDDQIQVYYKRKKSGTYDDADYYAWERPFMEKLVNAEDVHKNQKKLMMDLDFYQFAELIDIRPEPGSPFIHSMSEPFSEEDIQDEVLHNWLTHFGMPFHQLHASGHVDSAGVARIVRDIGAKKVFPVHTDYPAAFQKFSKHVEMAEKDREYAI